MAYRGGGAYVYTVGEREMNNKRWTTGEEKQLIQLLDAGHTYQEIADVIGRTKEAVSRRVYYLRKLNSTVKEARKYRTYTMDDKKQMQLLYDNGYSLDDIAKAYNTHVSLLYNYITPCRRKK